MLLTIGMIVKNEEKYLEQCLTALKPILDNVDSELIIADTGSTDRTVEIAKKFTNNVFYFEWINDFAAARNSTLDKAQGEWYMFIDADEILVDCTEIIEFFNSGEYKNYGSGTYIQKNYNDLSFKDLFTTYNPHRLTALINGVRFEKPIHENFNHYFTPVKNFNVIADHYGYVFTDDGKPLELMESKTTRNLELLFQELNDDQKPDNFLIYGQIADCYFILSKYDEALDYINQGLERCNPASYTIFNYYIKKLKTLNRLGGRHEEAIEVCKRYFSKDNLARKGRRLVTDCTVYFFWAYSSYSLGNLEEVINKAVLGFNIYRDYCSGKLYTPELNYCSVEVTIPMFKQICNMFIISCTKQGRYSDATKQLPNIPLKDFMPDTEYMKSHLNIRNMFMDKTNYNKLPDLYYSLDKPNREIYINILIRHIFQAEKQEQFLKKLSTLANVDQRLADIIKIYESHFFNHDLSPAQTTEFIKKYGTKNNEAVWILMMKNNFDISPFICAEDFNPEESVDELYVDVLHPDSAMDMFESSIYRLSENGVEKAVEAFGRAVYTATEKKFNTTKVIRTFGELGKRWMDLNPGKEVPENVTFALTLNEISDLHRKKHYEESIARLEELIGDEPEQTLDSVSEETADIAPEQTSDTASEASAENNTEPKPDNDNIKILRHYREIVREDEKKNAELMEKHNDNPMMVELAEQIKQEIRVMIDNWDLDGAEQALNQMARMAPFDPDIEDIRDEITDRKINYMNYM